MWLNTLTVSQFFFSSRRRHTRSKRDWSSDVCSSDLGDPRRTSAERHFEARHQLVADRAGATHRDEHAFLLVEPKEDRAIGTGHIQRLRRDRLRDLREVEASHKRLARPMEDVEVPLPRACLAI